MDTSLHGSGAPAANAILLILCLLGGIAYLGVYIWSLIWLYNDAQRCGKNGCLLTLLIGLLLWPLGLLVWLLARPDRRR